LATLLPLALTSLPHHRSNAFGDSVLNQLLQLHLACSSSKTTDNEGVGFSVISNCCVEMASVALRIRISWLLICLCSSRTLKAISLFTLVSDPEVTLNGWCCELFPVFTELSGIALRPASHAAKKCHSSALEWLEKESWADGSL